MTTRTPAVLVLVLAAAAAAGCAARRAPAAAAPAIPSAEPAPAARPLSATAANAVKTAKAEDAALVCRIERPTGTNIAKRVCRTKEAMERDRKAAQDMLIRPRGAHRPE